MEPGLLQMAPARAESIPMGREMIPGAVKWVPDSVQSGSAAAHTMYLLVGSRCSCFTCAIESESSAEMPGLEGLTYLEALPGPRRQIGRISDARPHAIIAKAARNHSPIIHDKTSE